MTEASPDASVEDHALAAELAGSAARVLLACRSAARGSVDVELGRMGDHSAQEVLAEELARRAPGDAILSEEAVDDPARLTASRVWIIDPLDGTREYAEGRDDFAVHVALWQDGVLVAGAVALPARRTIYSTAAPPSPAARQPGGPLRLAVSRTRPPAVVDRLRGRLSADVVGMGSAGVKIMAVVDGLVDAYVHAGGQYEWDSAAPVAVARAAGLWSSRVDGSPLRYNQADPYLPDVLVCRPEDRDVFLDAIRATGSEGSGHNLGGAHDS